MIRRPKNDVMHCAGTWPHPSNPIWGGLVCQHVLLGVPPTVIDEIIFDASMYTKLDKKCCYALEFENNPEFQIKYGEYPAVGERGERGLREDMGGSCSEAEVGHHVVVQSFFEEVLLMKISIFSFTPKITCLGKDIHKEDCSSQNIVNGRIVCQQVASVAFCVVATSVDLLAVMSWSSRTFIFFLSQLFPISARAVFCITRRFSFQDNRALRIILSRSIPVPKLIEQKHAEFKEKVGKLTRSSRKGKLIEQKDAEFKEKVSSSNRKEK